MAACLICNSEKSYRYFKLSNLKCRKEIIPKLLYLFGSQDLKILNEGSLCSLCVQKTDSAFSFVKLARERLLSESDSDIAIPVAAYHELPVVSSSTVDSISTETVVSQSGICQEQDDHVYCAKESSVVQMKNPVTISFPKHNNKLDLCKAEQILKNIDLRNCVEELIIKEINSACALLASKREERSILSRLRPLETLSTKSESLIPEIIAEISTRMPLVYHILLTIAGVVDTTKGNSMKVIPSVASAYALLLHNRNSDMSAFQRLTSSICLEGHLTDEGFTRLNKLGITQSARSKLNMQDECRNITQENVAEELKNNPLVKIIGDNLDIYIKAAHERRSKANTDLHMFASNLVFSRVATPDMINIAPAFTADDIEPEHMTLHGDYKASIRNAYIVHISKILVELPAFDWLRTVVLKSRFPYERQMSRQTTRFVLPIQHKNENKLEDCCDILDAYEEYLNGAFLTAFGEGSTTLNDYKVVVGGDQLTRVRLQESKHLRNIAVNPQRRFEDLHPIVVEMWHNKQDLLDKAYKTLYNISSARQPGTLYHAKSILQRGSVNGKVKSRFKAHHDLLMTLGKALLKEHLMEFLGMVSEDSAPTKYISCNDYDRGRRWMTQEEKSVILQSLVGKFLDSNNFLEFDPYIGPSIISTSDELYNYCSNLCHWYLQVLEMDDTAKAGDITRVIPNCLNAIPLFFSHSRLSKYFVENIDYVLKCEFLLSPLQRMRVLEGSFVNLRGGANNNMESDLMQENTVRVMKNLIKQLGANKTKGAIDRTTAAAEAIKAVTDGLDCFISSRTSSSKHKVASSFDDEKVLARSLRKCRPFRMVAGRNCNGFKDIHASPLSKIDLQDFRNRVDQVVRRLTYGQAIVVDDERDEEESSSDED